MAAPVQQPEMAELPGGPAVQPSATAMHDGRGALEGNTSSSTAAAAARSDVYPEHTMNASNNEPVHASMHAINATSNNDDGAVRGADDELAASTTADNATITSQRSEEGLKGISSLQSAPASLPVQAAQTHKDRLPPSKTDFDAPRDSQEKGDQITLELLLLSGARKRFYFKRTATVSEVLAWTFKDWPAEWEEQRPRELSQLRLLHRGQFLQGSSKLSAHTSEDSSVTVMHLNIRPAESSESVKPKRSKTPSNKPATTTDTHGGGCCSGCTIC